MNFDREGNVVDGKSRFEKRREARSGGKGRVTFKGKMVKQAHEGGVVEGRKGEISFGLGKENVGG